MRSGAFHMDGVFVEIAQHERAFERGDEERCYFVCVCSGTNLAALYTSVDNAMDGGAPVVHRNTRAVSQHLVSIIGLDCRVQDRAAASNGRIIDLALKDGDDGKQALYGVKLASQRVRQALAGKFNAIERLLAIVSVFQSEVDDPPVAGGCPILNTAIEADDANEVLRDRARTAMDDWRGTIHRIVNRGIERGEIRPTTDADEVASLLIATLEGALMLSNLYKDSVHMQRAAAHMVRYIETIRFV